MNKRAILPVILVTFFVILSVFVVYTLTESPNSPLTAGESNHFSLTSGESSSHY